MHPLKNAWQRGQLRLSVTDWLLLLPGLILLVVGVSMALLDA